MALDAAAGNLSQWRAAHGSDHASVLWLAEGRGEGAASRLREVDGSRWRLEELDEVTWRLQQRDGSRLTLIRGRQYATVEGLEVVVVGTAEPLADGRPLLDVIGDWIKRPVLVMIPWSFGKWTGRRGRLVSEAYEAFAPHGLRLADTAARPAWFPMPRRLRRAAEAGSVIPAGSDPFPFPSCIGRVGRYGFVAPRVAPDARWPRMLEAIRGMEPTRMQHFGRRMGTVEFAVLQTRMQLRKQLSRES